MYFLFDIGGTKTRIGISQKHNDIDDFLIFPTQHDYHEAIARIGKESASLAGNGVFEKAAGGIATPIDLKKTMIIDNSKKETFRDWVRKPLKDDLEKKIGAPVSIENDAAMGALGEAMFGAGKEHNIVAYLTIGTGVGGAKIVNGKIDENASGFEPGKQIIDADSTLVPGDEPPLTLDELLGGAFIEERQKRKAQDINDDGYWGKLALYLSMGLSTTIAHWSPDVVVLGGSLMNKIPFKRLEENLDSILTGFDKLPRIKKGQLGDKCGLYGALHFLNSKK